MVLGSILVAGLLSIACVAECDEKDPKSEPTEAAKSVSKKTLDLMQEAVDAFQVSSIEVEPESAIKFGKSSKLRYDDQVRNLLDAGVWRLGEQGRPTAYVTIELYGAGKGQALLTYEFVSLTARQFSMISKKGPRWAPNVTELTFESLNNVPAASNSDKLRLVQMRDLARRFTARQLYQGQKIELRLLPQPIDRYKDEEHQIIDGATFVFANGTNPELGMLLETDGKTWKYGLFRLCTSAVDLQFDEVQVPGIQPNAAYGTNRAYTATRHSVQLPE